MLFKKRQNDVTDVVLVFLSLTLNISVVNILIQALSYKQTDILLH